MNTASYITELRKCRTLASSCCSGLEGPPGPPGPGVAPLYGSFISTVTQDSVLITDNPNSKPIEYSSKTLGAINTLNGIFPNSKIVIPVTGVYRILFSAQIDSTGGVRTIEIFPVVNGTSVANSNTRAVADFANENCLTVEFFLPLDVNDIFELYMTGAAAPALPGRILALPAVAAIGGGPTIPAIPSIILTIQRIG